jgi:hypothetical protein
MYKEQLECRTCGVAGSREDNLCRPVTLLDTCLDPTQPRDPRLGSACERGDDKAEYHCGVCGRPSVEELTVCYPRRRGDAAAPDG